MRNDKKAEEITFSRDGFRMTLYSGHDLAKMPATPADLAAAIKAMPSPARTLLLIDVVEDSSALGQMRDQLADAAKELEAAEARIEEEEGRAEQWKETADARLRQLSKSTAEVIRLGEEVVTAKGRVRELEAALAELVRVVTFGSIPGCGPCDAALRTARTLLDPAPEAAKPAEPQPRPHSLNEHTWCTSCDRFDPAGPCPGEPASPPSQGIRVGDTVEIVDFSERHNSKGPVTSVMPGGVAVLCEDGKERRFDPSELAKAEPPSPPSPALTREALASARLDGETYRYDGCIHLNAGRKNGVLSCPDCDELLGTCVGCGTANCALFDAPYCCELCRVRDEKPSVAAEPEQVAGELKPWPRSAAERNAADRCPQCKLSWVLHGIPCSPWCAGHKYKPSATRELHPDLDAEPQPPRAEGPDVLTDKTAAQYICDVIMLSPKDDPLWISVRGALRRLSDELERAQKGAP